MREAELQGDDFALHLGAVTGADQLERTLVAFGGALDHAGQERAAEALEACRVAALCAALHEPRIAVLADRDLRRQIERELALRALDVELLTRLIDGHALRNHDGTLADARLLEHDRNLRFSHHQTSHRSSPPTLRRRASLSDMSPVEVLMIEMPRPLKTRGI